MKTKPSVLIILGLFAFGCATATGPLFKEVSPQEHKGKVIVYFYRNSQPGSAATYGLRIDDENNLPLQNKGYHLLILDPGTYDLAVSFKSKLHAEKTFTFEGDMTYYIHFRADVVGYNPGLVTSGPIINYSIASVPRGEALEILRECRLIEVPGASRGRLNY